MSKAREFPFTSRDFDFIRRRLNQHAGITLSEAKQDMVYSRLSKRLRQLGLSNFKDYCRYLSEHPNEELEPFINALTTNLTSFFREPHHFEYLQRHLLPVLSSSDPGRTLHIWSAACSTGQEAYSIAMVLYDHLPPGTQARVLATDLDSQVLEKAERGIYPLEALEGIPQGLRKRHFLRGRGTQEGKARVRPHLRDMIRFRRLNLLETWPMRTQFDAIFCRNVFIYFDKATQTRLARQFSEHLTPNGHLFLGHSETLADLHDCYTYLGKTIYRRAA